MNEAVAASATASHTAVCCRLPHGLILRHPMDEAKTFELKGKNKAVIIGADYGTTMVPSDFWEYWIAVNAEFPAVISGAIFTAKDGKDAEAIAREFSKRKTGFEGMSQTAFGLKPAEHDDKE